jgi:hypothetical protein
MSPEQCLGNEVTAASDQYSLGILAYEMLTGSVPFTGSMLAIQLAHTERKPAAPHTVSRDVPQHVSDIVMRMIAKDPKDRWPTLAEAADALLEDLGATDSQMRRELSMLVASLPDIAGRPSLPPTPQSPTPRSVERTDITRPVIAAPRVQEGETAQIPATPSRATPMMPHTPTGSASPKHRLLTVAAIGAVSVAIVAMIAVSGNSAAKAAAAARDTTTAAERENVLGANGKIAPDLEATDSAIFRIGVMPMSSQLLLGDSVQLLPTVYGRGGDALPKKVRWSSGDTSLALVSSDGWVHAIKRTGTTPVYIYAEVGKKTGSASITVK